MHGEFLQLAFDVSEAAVSRYLRKLKQPGNGDEAWWLTFLHNHREVLAAIRLLHGAYVKLPPVLLLPLIEHGCRRSLHFSLAKRRRPPGVTIAHRRIPSWPGYGDRRVSESRIRLQSVVRSGHRPPD